MRRECDGSSATTTPTVAESLQHGEVVVDEQLGGLLRSYRRAA